MAVAAEAEVAYDADYLAEHGLLLGGCLFVVLAAYMLVSVLPWPWLRHNAKISRKQQHREPQDEASEQPALPKHRPPLPETTQVSSCRAAAAPAPAPAAESTLTLQTEFVSAISDHAPGRPFRFRAPGCEANGTVWTPRNPLVQMQQATQQQEQQLFSTPPRTARRQQQQQQQEQEQQEQETDSSWDAALLARCAADSPFISSVDTLQRSPAFRSHISQRRGRRLNYETAESHKLRVYKALREVDPPSFQQLFSRKDVQEYDASPPSRLLSAIECLASSASSLGLLALPWLLPSLLPFRTAAAAAWACLTLAAAVNGFTSPAAALLGIYATEGPFNMQPPLRLLLLASAAEAALVVLTCGVGMVVSLGFRMLSQQRQGFGDRVCRFMPLREVVRPMHFSAVPPAAGVRGPCTLQLDD